MKLLISFVDVQTNLKNASNVSVIINGNGSSSAENAKKTLKPRILSTQIIFLNFQTVLKKLDTGCQSNKQLRYAARCFLSRVTYKWATLCIY